MKDEKVCPEDEITANTLTYPVPLSMTTAGRDVGSMTADQTHSQPQPTVSDQTNSTPLTINSPLRLLSFHLLLFFLLIILSLSLLLPPETLLIASRQGFYPVDPLTTP